MYFMEAVGEAYDALFAATPLLERWAAEQRPGASDCFSTRIPVATRSAIVMAACSDISVSTIEAALGGLVKSGYLRMVGGGRSTAYERVGE